MYYKTDSGTVLLCLSSLSKHTNLDDIKYCHSCSYIKIGKTNAGDAQFRKDAYVFINIIRPYTHNVGEQFKLFEIYFKEYHDRLLEKNTI